MRNSSQNIILQSNVNNTITFTGRRYDSESGLYYYRNRMYSPNLGRFISKDPKEYIDGMNLYAYVKNNPLKYLDAMGTTSVLNISSETSNIKLGSINIEENMGSKIFGAEANIFKAQRVEGNNTFSATALSINLNLDSSIKDRKLLIGGSLTAIESKVETKFSIKLPFTDSTYNIKVSGNAGIGAAGEIGIVDPTKNSGRLKTKLGLGVILGIDLEWSVK